MGPWQKKSNYRNQCSQSLGCSRATREFGGRHRIILRMSSGKAMVVGVLLMETWDTAKCNQGDQGIPAGPEYTRRKLQSNQLYCKLSEV